MVLGFSLRCWFAWACAFGVVSWGSSFWVSEFSLLLDFIVQRCGCL